jgi:tRNA pseudouridine38-40 synthase
VRIALGIEYDGSAFHGWQSQGEERTVQRVVEQAVSRVADHPSLVVCAGRTDTGVHATAQVVHFDTSSSRTSRSWVFGTNANLPPDVSVLWAQPVPDEFHARFSATGRQYCYVILNRRTRAALLAQRVTWECRPLEVASMREAASYLIGEHDFSAYRAVTCQARSPIRHLRLLDVARRGELLTIEAEASGFLHHMVRNIAGVLMAIGAGKHPPAWAREVLELRDRTAGGVTAPPQGLYLTGVGYPDRFHMPRLPRMALLC